MKTALIFGASGGLGSALCFEYKFRQWKVIEVSRAECDFARPESVADFCKKLESEGTKIDTCIFATGKLYGGRILDVDPLLFEESLRINANTPFFITQKLLKLANPVRRFIYISSGTARLFIPGLFHYSLSKQLLVNFIRLAQLELPSEAFQPLVVWPGGLKTGFNNKGKLFGGFKLPGGLAANDPERVAQKIYLADVQGRKTLVFSRLVFIIGGLQRLFPVGIMRWLLKLRGRESHG